METSVIDKACLICIAIYTVDSTWQITLYWNIRFCRFLLIGPTITRHGQCSIHCPEQTAQLEHQSNVTEQCPEVSRTLPAEKVVQAEQWCNSDVTTWRHCRQTRSFFNTNDLTEWIIVNEENILFKSPSRGTTFCILPIRTYTAWMNLQNIPKRCLCQSCWNFVWMISTWSQTTVVTAAN